MSKHETDTNNLLERVGQSASVRGPLTFKKEIVIIIILLQNMA